MSAKADISGFVDALVSVMQSEGWTTEDIIPKAPAGCWARVGAAIGKTGDAARFVFRRRKTDILPLLSVKLANGATSGRAPTPKTEGTGPKVVKVATTERGIESLPEADKGNVDTKNTLDEAPVSGIKEINVDTSQFVTREELAKQLVELESRLTQLIQQTEPQAVSGKVAKLDMPPRPAKTGKAGKMFRGSREHFSARVDAALLRRFAQDRDRLFGGNQSRCLDWLLWNFYGKPKMSFEEEAEGECVKEGNVDRPADD